MEEDIASQEEYLATIQDQQDVLEEQIDTLNAETAELDDQIVALEDQISDKQEEIDANMELLKDRLCALYVAGDASTLEIILNSENLIDFAEKRNLSRRLRSTMRSS